MANLILEPADSTTVRLPAGLCHCGLSLAEIGVLFALVGVVEGAINQDAGIFDDPAFKDALDDLHRRGVLVADPATMSLTVDFNSLAL